MAINIALEIGTSYTTIFVENYNIVLREPTVVAFLDDEENTLRAVGEDALIMQGKTSEKINFVFPVTEGYIADAESASIMLAEFLKKIFPKRSKLFSPLKAILSVPAGLTVEERKVYEDVLVKAGISKIECMVLGYDIQAGRVSLGLKQVTDNPWNSIAEKYPVGTRLTRKVVKITNAGAFVELEEGIDGFLHADDLSWTKKVKHPGSELTVDQEIEVVVIESDSENHRIRLGVKQLSEDPWQQFCATYKPGSTLEGEVVSIADFGIFVRAPGGIEGLVNKSNLSESREETFEEAVKKYNVGDKINVYVVDVNPEKQKAAFSVKEFKRKQQRDEISQYMSSVDDGNDGAFTLGDLLKNKNN